MCSATVLSMNKLESERPEITQILGPFLAFSVTLAINTLSLSKTQFPHLKNEGDMLSRTAEEHKPDDASTGPGARWHPSLSSVFQKIFPRQVHFIQV